MLFEMLATCPEEVKPVLTQELQQLGMTAIKPEFKALRFKATEEQFYKAHLQLRTASGLFWILREGKAPHRKVLFSQAGRIHWEELLDSRHSFRVDGIAGDRGPDAMKSNDISKVVKQAIQDRFAFKKLPCPKVDPKDAKIKIAVLIHRGRYSISIATSGKSLHKRGYRAGRHPAPMKETLAAAVLKLAGYDGSQVLLDPMCGSGTLPIEAAQISLNKAPLIHRKKGEFAFEFLKNFNRGLWRQLQEECRLLRAEEREQPILARDISDKFLADAKASALRARVEKYIDFESGDFLKLKKPYPTGLVVINLPYGARLQPEREALEKLYSDIGHHLKHQYTGWQAALISSKDAPWAKIGLKPREKKTILNGSIQTKVQIYDLFAGKKRNQTKAEQPRT